MGAVRQYRVTQTREVIISTDDPVKAVNIANHVFNDTWKDGAETFGFQGYPVREPRVVSIDATEE